MIPFRDDNPTQYPPVITVSIIVLCVLVFFWQLSLGRAAESAIYALGAIPAVLFNLKELPVDLAMVPPGATVFTSMFLHGSVMHLAGNMLYLWIFGNNVEDALGHFRFIVFYLLCGTAAVFAQAIADPNSMMPMIGASGAISGVLGAYVLLYPHAKVMVAIPIGFYPYITSLKALWVLGLWLLLQILSSLLAAQGEAGVAFLAHVGGFIAGMILVLFMRRRGVRLFHPERGTARTRW